jgi:hypothetical protein
MPLAYPRCGASVHSRGLRRDPEKAENESVSSRTYRASRPAEFAESSRPTGALRSSSRRNSVRT